jgi:Mor family transcriptional regulator
MEKNEVLEELKEVIGIEAADRFVDHYSGTNLYTPKGIGLKRKYRKIREEFRDGAGYKDLARRYGYSEQHIRNVIHRRKKN